MSTHKTRFFVVGESSSLGKKYLEQLAESLPYEFAYEPSVTKFCSQTFPRHQVPKVWIENTLDSRKTLQILRKSAKRFYILWFGRTFSKEDLQAAYEYRVHTLIENYEPSDVKSRAKINSFLKASEWAEQSDHVIQSLKALLVSQEVEEAFKPTIEEMKAGLQKLEKNPNTMEYTGTAEVSSVKDSAVNFAISDSLADAILTVYELEKTGTLWVHGSLKDQEGKLEFLQGRLVAAETGRVNGVKAVYRMFLWDETKYEFTRANPQDFEVLEPMNEEMRNLCESGNIQKERFQKIRGEIPPLDIQLALEPTTLHAGIRLTPEEFSTLGSVVEFQKVSTLLDYNELADVVLLESLITLKKNGFLRIRA